MRLRRSSMRFHNSRSFAIRARLGADGWRIAEARERDANWADHATAFISDLTAERRDVAEFFLVPEAALVVHLVDVFAVLMRRLRKIVRLACALRVCRVAVPGYSVVKPRGTGVGLHLEQAKETRAD